MSKKRKNYSPEEKVAILKRHLVEKVHISDLCDQLGLHPLFFTVGRPRPSLSVLGPKIRDSDHHASLS